MANCMILDGHKLNWHMDRVRAWEQGERIAPVTMDIALTSRCQYRCQFCAAQYQTGQRATIPTDRVKMLLEDAADMGVRGMVFMSDGESTLHPDFAAMVEYGKGLGLDMAAASNGFLLTPKLAERILPHLTYLRINFSAGEPSRYSQIMGVSKGTYERVVTNIRRMVEFKHLHGLAVTINMSMVLRPQDADQILPFARLGKELGVDYAIVKHCLDYTGAPLAVDYGEYERVAPIIKEAEALSTPDYLVTAKWHTMMLGQTASSRYCYGPAFLLQVSGMGLLAACGPLFAPRYAKHFHIGNVRSMRLIDLWRSDRYQEVMDYLRSEHFVEHRDCQNYLCVQRNINEALDKHLKGEEVLCEAAGEPPAHVNFI